MNILCGNTIQISVDNCINNSYLASNSDRTVSLLLKHLNDTLSQRQTRLGIRIKIGANILLTASLPAISPMTKTTTDKILKLPLLWIKAENSKLEAATIHKRISAVARTAPEDLTVSVLKA